MASLRPPSNNGSRSPSPQPIDAGRANPRSSMGPSARPTGFQGTPLSPRPGGARPTSELLGNNINFQTPEAEAIDQWFENLQSYEATLEEMAAASLDVNFKEELSAIEQWFKVLSEAERTAALYSLLQHSTQVQIRFFITVLQQMARADPMTALLSPAVGGSMQAQMEAKLAQMSLKSAGLKSNFPSSPVARSFSTSNAPGNRNSLAVDTSGPSLLSPESANVAASPSDAAGVLAQQRAKLKANAAHRISAPALATMGGAAGLWGSNTQLDQVSERAPSPSQEVTIPASSSRPKSTDFSGLANALRSPKPGADVGGDQPVLSPMVGDSWASMVNTPLIPMFQNTRNNPQNLDAAAAKLNDWSNGAAAGGAGARVPMLDDAKKFRRPSKADTEAANGGQNNNTNNNNAQQRNAAPNTGSWRSQAGGGNNNGANNWSGAKSPALSTVSSRMGGSDDGSMAGLSAVSGFGMGMPGMAAMGSPGLGMGMPGMANLAAAGMNPFMLNMAGMANMGITPEAQLLAAQMAASGFNPGLSPFSNLAALQAQQIAAGQLGRGGGGNMGGANNAGRARGGATNQKSGGAKKDEEDVDPRVLEDIPAWLRSLRLHKYTPNFEGMNWREMVLMDEAALEAKGVAALGARRKMLKTFEIVRNKMGIPHPEGTTTGGDESS